MSKPKTIMFDEVKYVRAESIKSKKELTNEVIIRTYSDGVHVGTIKEGEKWTGENTIIVENCRQIYRWRGANTLNEVAMLGVNRNEYTKISKPSEWRQLKPIGIIPVAENVDLSEVWND